jgi:protein ImuB
VAGVRRLSAVDGKAAALGLFVGQKATDAAALAPELATADADDGADGAALIALADWCVRFSPAVAMAPPDSLFLDITGAAHLWNGEGAMLADLTSRLAKNHIPARGAVADTPGCAWALAHFAQPGTIAPVGHTAAHLAPLPARALRLEPADAQQIGRLGLSKVGALMGLPRAQLTRRFGPQVVRRLDEALGRAEEALVFRRPPTPWLARLAFAEPISAPEDLVRVARDAADRLCARLEAAAKGARRFELCFHRLDGQMEARAIGLSLPGREALRIAALFAPHLESVDPGFGVEVVTLAAEEVEAMGQVQGQWTGGEGCAARAGVAPLVDRLANRLGEDRVWRAEAFPSHLPERAVTRRPPLSPGAGAGWDAERPRPLRLFSRPQPIEAMAPVPDDPPILFRWRGLSHRVRRAEGPERLAQEWWRLAPGEVGPGHVRDYYRVEDEAGARFWLFRAGLYAAETAPRWWLHGLFG